MCSLLCSVVSQRHWRRQRRADRLRVSSSVLKKYYIVMRRKESKNWEKLNSQGQAGDENIPPPPLWGSDSRTEQLRLLLSGQWGQSFEPHFILPQESHALILDRRNIIFYKRNSRTEETYPPFYWPWFLTSTSSHRAPCLPSWSLVLTHM